MKNALIVSGGWIQEEFALSFLQKEKYEEIIAADRGLEFLARHQIRPTYIVGDFDSAGKNLADQYRGDPAVKIRVYPSKKAATDTQIAVELALELQCASITILGATGTRLDHVIGNIQTMALALEQGVPCRMIDANNRIRLIRERTVLKREEQYGDYVSLLPLTTRVEHVALTGFQYPLTDHTFSSIKSAGLGVSNVITAEEAVIEPAGGVLILVESKD